jgi:chromosomal replication initiation ATPase DnaA
MAIAAIARRPLGRDNARRMAHDQYALEFPHRPTYAAVGFLRAPSNEEALAWLDRTDDWPDRRLALWGEPGCGKSHLLHIWAGPRGAAVIAGAALPALPPPPPAAGLAIDDADAAAEPALLHLLNAAREAGAPVLLAARVAPARWPVRLPDLASRLRAITAVEIRPAEDSLLRSLLLRLLSDRQLGMSEPLQEYLLRRLPRSPAALREAAARLDHAALAVGGGITRPITVAVLADMLGADVPE